MVDPSKVPEILECLVGRNQTLDANGIYGDGYIARLNQIPAYSLVEILGTRLAGISKGHAPFLGYLTSDSPLQCTEAEQVLDSILYRSAGAKLWQPKIIDVPALVDTQIKTAEEYLKEVEARAENDYSRGRMDGGLVFGIGIAKKGGFVKTTRLDEKVIVIPSQSFVEYCAAKCRQ